MNKRREWARHLAATVAHAHNKYAAERGQPVPYPFDPDRHPFVNWAADLGRREGELSSKLSTPDLREASPSEPGIEGLPKNEGEN